MRARTRAYLRANGCTGNIFASQSDISSLHPLQIVLAVIPPLFFIAEKHLMDDPEEFRSALTPIVELLFRINDRGVRGALLQRSNLYSAHLDQAALNNSVFEPMCSGFTDSSAALRELTLKSAILLVPKLTPSNLEKLVRYLIRLQSDPEPSIRTNTAIFVGKVAPNLSEMSTEAYLASVRACNEGRL